MTIWSVFINLFTCVIYYKCQPLNLYLGRLVIIKIIIAISDKSVYNVKLIFRNAIFKYSNLKNA